jgi:hypothetical protein
MRLEWGRSGAEAPRIDCLRLDIDEHNSKSQATGIKHHLKTVFAGKCRLDGNALLVV